MVERLTCNEDVAGSTPVSGSISFERYCIYLWLNYYFKIIDFGFRIYFFDLHSADGGVPEWSKGTDCKSVGKAFGGSNPPPTTILKARHM